MFLASSQVLLVLLIWEPDPEEHTVLERKVPTESPTRQLKLSSTISSIILEIKVALINMKIETTSFKFSL